MPPWSKLPRTPTDPSTITQICTAAQQAVHPKRLFSMMNSFRPFLFPLFSCEHAHTRICESYSSSEYPPRLVFVCVRSLYTTSGGLFFRSFRPVRQFILSLCVTICFISFDASCVKCANNRNTVRKKGVKNTNYLVSTRPRWWCNDMWTWVDFCAFIDLFAKNRRENGQNPAFRCGKIVSTVFHICQSLLFSATLVG